MLTKYFKEAIALMALIVLFSAGGIMAPIDAAANDKAAKKVMTVENPIKIIGRSQDNRYPIYDLEGDLEDLNWSSNSILYTSQDLINRMEFITEQDRHSGVYECGLICKDKAGHVVGLNPQYKYMKALAAKK